MSNIDSLRQAIRDLWRQVNRFLEEDKRRKPIEKELVRESLELATALINEVYQTSPSIEQLGELGSEASRVLNDIIRFSNNDEMAEAQYQLARLGELAADVLLPDRAGRLFMAGRDYERAVDFSKRGSRAKLAFYEKELVEFRRRSK